MSEKTINVLLIEDNPGDARLIQEFLSEPGGAMFTLECVEQLSTGLNRLAEGGIDVILLDLGLPDSQGLDTFAKTHEQVRHVPIVVLTGLDDETMATQAMRAGAQDYLAKGQMDSNLLIRTMRYAIERKQSEEALRKSRDYLDRIVNGMNEGLVVINRNFIIKEVNDRFVKEYGSVREDIIGRTCYEITHKVSEPCSSSDHRCPVREVFNTGKPARVEHIHRDRSGGELIVELYAFPLLGEDGKIEHVIELSHNITERTRAEEEKRGLETQLIHAQKMQAIGTLAGGIAHDFNNLLSVIQGNVALILFDVDANQPHYRNLKRIEKQIQRGSKLTHQILAYARKEKHDVKPINLNELVAETSEAFGTTRKDTTIYRELTEDLYAIEADHGQIEQVLLNLYVNATHAMPGGGDLILKTMNVTHDDMKGKGYDPRPGNYVLLTVTDTGTGIDKETQGRIFDPFFTTKEMGRGTGLGLASVYGIVKGHAGYIDVDSEKGRGTTFSIYLPATEKKIKKSVEIAEPVIRGSGTILLVDDEEMVLETGAEVLKKLGYRVLEAKGGREALKIYSENNPIDLVILDVIMPDIGGGEAYDKMKEMNPNVKVLLSSGYSIDGEAKEILDRGCDAFIQKPFDIKELSKSVKQVLGKE